jgi:nucleoid DNA-binding protein
LTGPAGFDIFLYPQTGQSVGNAPGWELAKEVRDLTKKDIVMKVSNETNLTQIDVKKIVQKTLDVISDSLQRGETVELRNFGVFKVKSRRGRIGRNPRTGQEVSVPEKKVVVFKPGLILKVKVK